MTGSIRDLAAVYIADNACSPEDASAFWARLPEKVAIALVKAAPKVASAWWVSPSAANDSDYILAIAARDLSEESSMWVNREDGQFYWRITGGERSQCTFATLAEAQADADDHLKADGVLLESEESP